MRKREALSRSRTAPRNRRTAAAMLAACALWAQAAGTARAETPAYEWSLVSKTALPATMHPGEKLAVTVVLRNDGTARWEADRPGAANPVRLGTTGPRDRSSLFASDDPTWLWSNGTRVRMTTPSVAPGENGVFTFTFTAPALASYPQSFDERFALVAEGSAWADAHDISFVTSVRPLAGALPALPNPPIPQPPAVDAPCDDFTPHRTPRGIAAGYSFGTPLPTSVSAPQAIASDPVGMMVVADTGNDRVLRIETDGDVVFSWASTAPAGVATSSNGRVYVSDPANDRVRVFSLGGIPLTSFGGIADPRGLAVASDGTLLVADTTARRIVMLSPAGLVTGEIADPALVSPVSVSTFAGEIYVSDTGAHVIRRYGFDGALLGAIGGPGNGAGCLRAPGAVVANAYGVFVADSGRDRIVHYDHDGLPIESWGSTGTAAGRMQIPAGLAFDGASVLVAERAGNRLQRFNARASAAPPLPCGGDPRTCLPN